MHKKLAEHPKNRKRRPNRMERITPKVSPPCSRTGKLYIISRSGRKICVPNSSRLLGTISYWGTWIRFSETWANELDRMLYSDCPLCVVKIKPFTSLNYCSGNYVHKTSIAHLSLSLKINTILSGHFARGVKYTQATNFDAFAQFVQCNIVGSHFVNPKNLLE